MKIEQVHIKNFGHFRNYSLPLGGSNFTIIYGENEAGKSTLTHFFKHLMLGMPRENTYQYYLSGNQKGGYGEGTLDSGLPFKLESFKRKTKARPSITAIDPSQQSHAEEFFDSLIKTIGDQVYKNLFACTIGDIHNTSKFLKEKDFKDFLSQFLIGGQNPKAVIKNLNTQAEEYFNTVRGKKKLKRIKESIGDLKDKVSTKELKSSVYYDKRSEYEAAEKKCQSVNSRIQNKRHRLDLLRFSNEWIEENHRIAIAQLEIETIKPPDHFPLAGLALMQEHLKNLESKQVLLIQLKTETVELEVQINELVCDEAIVDQADQVKFLEVNSKEAKRLLQKLPEALTKSEELDLKLKKCLANLGEDWQLNDLEQLQISSLNRAKLDSLGESYHKLSEKTLDIENSLLKLQQEEQGIERQRLAYQAALIPKAELQEREEFFINQVLVLLPKLEELSTLCGESYRLVEALYKDLAYEGTEFESIDRLVGQKYPESSQIEDFASQHTSLLEKKQALQTELNENQEKISKIKRALKRVREEAGVSDLSLSDLRKQRDHGWQSLKEKITGLEQGKARKPEVQDLFSGTQDKLEHDFEEVTRKIDFLTDKIIEHHELVSLEKERQELDGLCSDKESALESLEVEESKLLAEWQMLWSSLPLTPLKPKLMLDWRQSLSKLRVEYAKYQALLEQKNRVSARVDHWIANVKQYLARGTDASSIKEAFRIFLAEQNRKQALLEKLDQEILEKSTLTEKQSLERSFLQKEVQQLLDEWNHLFTKVFPEKAIVYPEDWRLFSEALDDSLIHLETYRNHQIKIAKFRTELDAFTKVLKQVCRDYGIDLQENAIQISLDHVFELFSKHSDNHKRQQSLMLKLKHKLESIHQQESELNLLKQQMTNLLAKTECKSHDSFIDAGKAYQLAQAHVEALQASRKNQKLIEEKIKKLGHCEQLLLDLKSNKIDLQQVEQELLSGESEIVELERELKQAYENLAKKKIQFDNLDGSEDVAFYQSEISSKESEFHDGLMDYLSLKLSAKILTRVLERFESQTHPEFIKLASLYLSEITSGKYQDISEEDDEYFIERAEGSPLAIGELSTGTMEQLYLSMRLAAMEQLASKGETLPFVLDDILANSDHKRTSKALRVISKLARKTQIIYLTCHPSFIETAKSCLNYGTYNIVNLNQMH
ncbi:MAG: AAA family ATPase [Oligoflexales bacterium]|nr:AAA family ATPase [Oligoflexales bacterium]